MKLKGISDRDLLIARLVTFSCNHLRHEELGAWAKHLQDEFGLPIEPHIRYVRARQLNPPELADLRFGSNYIIKYLESSEIEIHFWYEGEYLRVLSTDGVVSSEDWSALVAS